MAQNITLLGASYSAVPAVMLPKTGGGNALFADPSPVTAVATDVRQGKYFIDSSGNLVEGTSSGGGSTRTTVIPEQTIVVSTAYTQITNYTKLFVTGEEYIITLNGVEYIRTAEDWYGSIALLIFGNQFYLETTGSGNIFLDVDDTSRYGTYTLKVEQESGGAAVLISKTITANGTYNASDDNADGYSDVTVNVSGGVTPAGTKIISVTENGTTTEDVTQYADVQISVNVPATAKNVQTAQSTTRRNNTALGSITSLICSKAGTYDVYWACARSSTSGTWGSQLYINGTAYGSENTTFTNHVQVNHLSNVTIPAGATVAVYGRSSSGYYIYAPQLTIVEA